MLLKQLNVLRKFEEEEHNLVFVYYNLLDDIDDEESKGMLFSL